MKNDKALILTSIKLTKKTHRNIKMVATLEDKTMSQLIEDTMIEKCNELIEEHKNQGD